MVLAGDGNLEHPSQPTRMSDNAGVPSGDSSQHSRDSFDSPAISPVMTSDARDLEVARAGGGGPDAHAAFARIYDRHSPVVRALCRRNSPSEVETDDALQETFIRAF